MIGFLMDENEKMRKLVMELLDYSKLEYQKENHTEDEMYGKYVEGAAEVTKAAAQSQTENGTVSEATGTNISGWAFYQDGQETYEVGSATQDARHFDKFPLFFSIFPRGHLIVLFEGFAKIIYIVKTSFG